MKPRSIIPFWFLIVLGQTSLAQVNEQALVAKNEERALCEEQLRKACPTFLEKDQRVQCAIELEEGLPIECRAYFDTSERLRKFSSLGGFESANDRQKKETKVIVLEKR